MDTIALDLGAGNDKLKGAAGHVLLPAQVAAAHEGVQAGAATGLKMTQPPLGIRLDSHRFYVGLGSHAWGYPVENLDDGRFMTGAPELYTVIFGTLSEYHRRFGLPEAAHLWVGAPQSALRPEIISGMRSRLKGELEWVAIRDGVEQREGLAVREVTVTSQAAGALFDFLLDEDGQFLPGRKALFKAEIGIVSVGMNTLELLVIEGGHPKERFTASTPIGVRRLLALVDPRRLYSRGELDTQLRNGTLDVAAALPIWTSEVIGAVEEHWGRAARRFATTVVVGGGALLLGPALTIALAGKTAIPDDPLMAVARGIYKLALQKESRKRS